MAAPPRARGAALLPPTMSRHAAHGNLEYSVHRPPGSLRRDIAPVFPALCDASRLLLVPTLQRARVPLEAFGDAQAVEKDRLLDAFFAWAALVRGALLARGAYWVDVTDPATGAARYGRPAALYSDVPPIARLLRYPTLDCGGCCILRHPEWGSAVYPATLFTDAPEDVLLDVLATVNGASGASPAAEDA